jgi:hypothetical protein
MLGGRKDADAPPDGTSRAVARRRGGAVSYTGAVDRGAIDEPGAAAPGSDATSPAAAGPAIDPMAAVEPEAPDTDSAPAASPWPSPAPTPTATAAAPPASPHLARFLVLLGLGAVVLVGGLVAGGFWLYHSLYSPTAFVERYVGMLASGDAADALEVPGVAVDRSELEAAGLPTRASDALLREAALGSITQVRTVSERTVGDTVRVTLAYRAGGHAAQTTFVVRRAGWIGVAPAWRFARSPLAVIELSVHGSMTFRVNGFTVDKRQVSPDGASADPAAALPLLVFSPGLYSVSVDTAAATSPGVAILSDSPMKDVPVHVQAQPTKAFVEVVQKRVDEFLTACASQTVLQPTGCPFGYIVENRVDDLPTWSIVAQPAVTLVPDGEGWRIPSADATAHIVVDVRSIYDGSVRHVDEDVPFGVAGTVTMQPDGTASIVVTSPDTD